VRDPWELTELSRRFAENSASSRPRAPLYAELSKGIAADPSLHGLLLHAPPDQRLPVLLFACVHASLLADADHDLAAWYPTVTDAPRSPEDPELITTFARFVEDRAPQILAMLATRSTQTNEVGRCIMFLVGFDIVTAEVGPLAHVDVGCSGGLTLLSDRYQYRYEHGADRLGRIMTTVGSPSTVQITTSVRGELVLPEQIPTIAARCGIDIAPIDVTDDAEAKWLEACVWPDQPDRARRLRAAIALAREQPPELVAGDAVEQVAATITRLASSGHPVVTNSWVLNYLTGEQRSAYVSELDRIGSELDFSWIYAEAPALTPELPWDVELDDPHLTMIALARWRSGRRTVEYLATSHPHGYWIHAY